MLLNIDLAAKEINKRCEERQVFNKKYHIDAINVFHNIPTDRFGKLVIEPNSREEAAYNELLEARLIR